MLTLRLLGRGAVCFVLTLLLLIVHGLPLSQALIGAAVLGAAAVLPLVFLAAASAILALTLWAAAVFLLGAPSARELTAGPGAALAERVIEGAPTEAVAPSPEAR